MLGNENYGRGEIKKLKKGSMNHHNKRVAMTTKNQMTHQD